MDTAAASPAGRTQAAGRAAILPRPAADIPGGGRSFAAPANRGYAYGGRAYGGGNYGRAYGGGGYYPGRFYAGHGYYYGGRFWARPYFGVGIGIPFGYGYYNNGYGCGYYDGYGNWEPAPCYVGPGY